MRAASYNHDLRLVALTFNLNCTTSIAIATCQHRAPTKTYCDFTMAGPKYQNVPQRDSLDEAAPGYSQAPPSYSAEANDPNEALLRGVPRGEDDNLPDDFKFGGVVSEATLDIRMAFVRKVYAIL